MLTYRSIIKESLKFTLSNKILWLLGFFVALLGNGGEYEILFRTLGNDNLSIVDVVAGALGFIPQYFLIALKNLVILNEPLTSFGILLSLCGLVYLSVTSQGAIIKSIYSGNDKTNKIAVKKHWLSTRDRFFELLFVNIIFKGGGFILAALLAWPFIVLFSHFFNVPLIVSAVTWGIVIFVPMAMAVSFLVKFTLIFMIAEGKDPIDAWIKSLQLFQTNWLIVMELALVLFAINFVFGLFAFLVAMVISFPFIAAVSIVVYPMALPEGYYATIIAWVSLIVGPLLGTILATFQYSAWVRLWEKLISEEKLHSKLVRVVDATLRKVI